MKTGPSTDSQRETGSFGGSTLWLWVVGGFLLLILAWTVMFTVAHSAKVESVPLATKEVRT